MEVDLILKIAGIGVLTGVVTQILKHTGKQWGILIVCRE